MSIYGMMRTSISGMAAQAHRLTAVSDNIANADTTGYRRSSVEFTSLVLPDGASGSSSASLYESGSVVPHLRRDIAGQGTLRFTSSSTDLAIDGAGFFIVEDANGTPQLTRAGSFIPDSDGNLYNSAGLFLQGYPIVNGEVQNVVNGFGGLENINTRLIDLVAVPSTAGVFKANLPSAANAISGTPPSGNTATAEYSQKSSLTVYDNLGGSRVVDVYMTKTATNTWEVAVYDQSTAAAPGAPFPYASGPLVVETLAFSPADGTLAPPSPAALSIAVPGGATLDLDISGMTQLGTGFIIADARVNGNEPSSVERIEIRSDGTLYAGYGNGSFRAIYKIPLATVVSPNQLSALSGTAYGLSAESGGITIGFVGEGGVGQITSSALEQSNVDIAEELTSMIQAQRGYSANSKVFQTGSEVTEIAINLKR
jgi:flagellar hook protein FlgE